MGGKQKENIFFVVIKRRNKKSKMNILILNKITRRKDLFIYILQQLPSFGRIHVSM
jgi:hypothetical protein